MRLGAKRIICCKPTKFSKAKVTFSLFIIFLAAVFVFASLFFLKRIRPLMVTLSVAQAHNIAVSAINDTVISVFSDEKVSYSDIITFIRTDDNKITAAQSNLEGINILKAELSRRIQQNLTDKKISNISVPLGSLIGSDTFSGMGPYFDIPLMPYSITNIEFVSSFSDSGINQTRLTVDLDVCVQIALLIPTAKTSTSVKTKIPVIQTVIVGDVPGSYTNVERSGESFEDDVLQLAE